MLQLTPQTRILVATEPADFRRGIDGLAALCRSALGSDPFSGALFVFCNRQRNALKIICYDGQGFWLCHKRLSKGTFRCWPRGTDSDKTRLLQAHELWVLLRGGDPQGAKGAPQWRPLAPTG